MLAIEMTGVSKTYSGAPRPALEAVDLEVAAGERLGLIGANGSGKTTLMRLLMNFVLPERGSIRIMGERNLEKARRFMGFVPERQEGMENFTPRELLRIAARMYRMEKNRAAERIAEMLNFTQLSGFAGELVAGFSKGMAQRLQIGIALIHQPRILLLDEPMSGLDPGGQKDVREVLARLSDRTLVYASHNLEEIETFCTVVVILQGGRVIHRLNLQEIRQEIYTLDASRLALEILSHFPDLKPRVLRETGEKVRVEFAADYLKIQKLLAALNERRVDIQRLRSRSVLEDYYHRYVAGAGEA
ncbi:MAG: ABC transporter ATP-binding protein [Calditrichaceae bacterium]|nr:ABC transporter ATP-binding protein [Calditrichia bacterium]NUQ40516.1 ABC transporter ATP-binding protein [Calditrichaceae bacterium]